MYFKLQSHNYKLKSNDIQLKLSNKIPDAIISKSFHRYLSHMKDQINFNIDKWTHTKIYTNPYEYIHTQYEDKMYLSKLNPVSRSFYKLIEMFKTMNLLEDINSQSKSLHLAEGPGGFIQAIVRMKVDMLNGDGAYGDTIGVTLQSLCDTVPNWNKLKSILPNNHNITFDNLHDNSGDLYNPENIQYACQKYKNSMEIITADGGFDFSTNYKLQEHKMVNLLLFQCFYAILCQKKNGIFIMKIFDVFIQSTIDIIYILNMFYEQVYICKPVTSRPANSEKYIVCKYFKYSNTLHYLPHFKTIISQCQQCKDHYIQQILKIPIHDIFINKLEEINIIFGQKQIENITSTLIMIDNYISNDTIENYKKNNIQQCVQWLTSHNIGYNTVKLNSKKNTNNHTLSQQLLS